MKPDFNTLQRLYETERLSMQQIADRFGVHNVTVSTWLRTYGIKRLPRETLANAKQPIRPDIETVRRLYETERLTTRQIGAQFGVSKTEVLRWLIFYDIPRRDSHNGLLNRGIKEPTKEELIHLVHVEYKSYRDIAKIYNVDFTAVPYWLKKHQIELPEIRQTRFKGQRVVLPTKEELSQMYLVDNLTLQEIANKYEVSQTPIASLCKEFGIPIRPDGFNGGIRFSCDDGHLVRSTYEQKVDNWLHEHGIPHRYEPRLPFDHRSHADFLANGWYIEVWGVNGSKAYAQRKARKISLYNAHQIPLIQLSIDSFQPRRKDSWKRTLTRCLVPLGNPQILPTQSRMDL